MESTLFANPKVYRYVFLVASRPHWPSFSKKYDPDQDLLLTFDFGLQHEVERLGGPVYYIDHLSGQSEMQENNFLAAEFIKTWHFDRTGKDIFTAHGIPFGFAFRMEMWTEYLFYVRLRANLEKLRAIQYTAIFVGEAHGIIANVLRDMALPFTTLEAGSSDAVPAYFFDIHKYMHDALHGKTLRTVARDALVRTTSALTGFIDGLRGWRRKQKTVYAQIYHPTRRIIEQLQKDPGLRVVTASPMTSKGPKKYFVQRMIPMRGRRAQFDRQAEALLAKFRMHRHATLSLRDGTDITAGAYAIIERQIQPRVADALWTLRSVLQYVEKTPIHLEVMIANIGVAQTIVDCVLKTKQVPRYLIINGLMTGRFCDEARYATVINGYSESIKEHYYENASHVVCLGDPRMDEYVARPPRELINRAKPTISIGTSGFNNLDLNSYVAVEFDFMFDVLSALQELKEEGRIFDLIIKVRFNGVLEQYKAFALEYFPGLEIEIVRDVPISQVLYRTDLYISIYSQTIFEASCLGIPAIYYKKDTELVDPPFDQKSEVVSADTVASLKQAIIDFQAGHNRFDAFLDKRVMEKYVGPLDGQNLERNLKVVYGFLGQEALEP